MASSRVVSFSDRPTVVSAARQTAVSVRPTMPVLLSPTVQVPQTNTVTQYTPPKWTAPATNSDIINAIADCMNKPPTNIDENYMLNAMWVAEYLNVGATTETSAQLASNTSDLTKLLSQQGGTVTRGASTTPSTWLATTSWAVTIALAKVVVRPTTNPQMSVTTPVTWVTNESGRSVANQSVANVLAFIQRAEDFLSQAAADGFAPPDNPFTVIATLNANRKGQFTKMTVDSQQADDLVYNIKVIVDLLEAQNQGGIDLTTGRVDAAQMSHLHLSFDGLGGSGNPAADILKFLPSVDDVKRATEESTLSVLDFSLRVPYLLFTMEYRPVAEEPPVGTLVGFKRIADASGYIIAAVARPRPGHHGERLAVFGTAQGTLRTRRLRSRRQQPDARTNRAAAQIEAVDVDHRHLRRRRRAAPGQDDDPGGADAQFEQGDRRLDRTPCRPAQPSQAERGRHAHHRRRQAEVKGAAAEGRDLAKPIGKNLQN